MKQSVLQPPPTLPTTHTPYIDYFLDLHANYSAIWCHSCAEPNRSSHWPLTTQQVSS